jgi:hypothetical protein
VAGNIPTSGVIVIHGVPTGAMAVVNAALLVPPLTESACAAGSAPPACQTNDNDAGAGVSSGTGMVCASKTTGKKQKRRGLTLVLIDRLAGILTARKILRCSTHLGNLLPGR